MSVILKWKSKKYDARVRTGLSGSAQGSKTGSLDLGNDPSAPIRGIISFVVGRLLASQKDSAPCS